MSSACFHFSTIQSASLDGVNEISITVVSLQRSMSLGVQSLGFGIRQGLNSCSDMCLLYDWQLLNL